ncbi:MAG TPA: hypothetical protein VFO83_06970 [Aggregicoccus sp.]|nr:hypothetical protein [Aggregicoccus sp.]
MSNYESMSGNGHGGPRVGERVDQLGSSAQQFFTDARGAVHDLGAGLDLKGRVQRNPYGMVAAALGVGYVLGGGLFTPLTARMLRVGVRLAMLPFVKDELMGMAEAAVQGFASASGQGGSAGSSESSAV